jgi:uncharacterized membrane protein required for colicin V production
VCFLFAVLDKFVDFMSLLPFLKTINHLAGGILGFIEGSLIVGLLFLISTKYIIFGNLLDDWIAASKLIPFLVDFVKVLLPLVPDLIEKANSIVGK